MKAPKKFTEDYATIIAYKNYQVEPIDYENGYIKALEEINALGLLDALIDCEKELRRICESSEIECSMLTRSILDKSKQAIEKAKK